MKALADVAARIDGLSKRMDSMKASKAFQQIKRRPAILEDRREYDAPMLKRMYDLTDGEASELYRLIQAEFR